MTNFRRNVNMLAYILFFAIFMNGFEAGGYQVCLLSIGQEFQVNNTTMGLLASVQLIAILIAPFIFGAMADRIGKKKVMSSFLVLRLLACFIVLFAYSTISFVPGIFLMGFAISMIQYLSMAALADAYPRSGQKKLGIITSFYSLGAVTAPLICGHFLELGFSWRLLFILLALTTLAIIIGIIRADFSAQELPLETTDETGKYSQWNLPVILILCFIMFIYVGVENGFAFFLNAFISLELNGSQAYLALSLFWLAMIPSRILCGYFARYKQYILVAATVGVALFAWLMSGTDKAVTAMALSFILGFFSGAVYPSVLGFAAESASSRTATAMGMITAATGLGGALIASLFGWTSTDYGMRTAMVMLGVLMLFDVVAALVLNVLLKTKHLPHT